MRSAWCVTHEDFGLVSHCHVYSEHVQEARNKVKKGQHEDVPAGKIGRFGGLWGEQENVVDTVM